MIQNWLDTYETVAYDDEDNEHKVTVTYNWVAPRAATYWEPSEGGVEIEDVVCKTLQLTDDQIERIEQEVIDYAWEQYHNKGYDE
jgi:hypothetical protein